MKLSDLSSFELILLQKIGEDWEEHLVGYNLRTANNLASYGLAEYAGSGRYKLTNAGMELYREKVLFSKKEIKEEIKEEIINHH